jgi:dihydrodipicolinate synthase/N-acetylneuraminate lyase
MMTNDELKDGFNSVTTIPVIPFRNGKVDYEAHAKNIRYLMENNYLSDDRPRVVCIAGTSLIHHIGYEEQNKLIEVTGAVMGNRGVLLSALVPNPIDEAGHLIETQSAMVRPPDAYLIMPLTGVYSVEGLYGTFKEFGDKYGTVNGARFLYYHRQPRDRDMIVRLINYSEHFIGVKVGTVEEDVPFLVDAIGDNGLVIWGVGDRSTQAARLGAKGHTSGISVLFARAGDEINNAQRVGSFEKSMEYERRIAALEEIRFENGRVFNYSAVVEGMIASGFSDIDGGEGGPFNPRVPAEVAEQVKEAIRPILDLH